ncbi:MAG: RimK family alpha-L-glutamate ligase [Pseudobdellovibrionaceae bacterium]
MKIWYLWEGDLNGDVPGTYEMKRLLEEGRKRGHDARVFAPGQFKILVGGCKDQNVFIDSVGQERPDVVMSRMGAASTYLSLSILRHLRRHGVTVVNYARAIERSADKMVTMQELAERGIPIPKTMFARCPVDSQLITQQIGYPVIVKTLKGTQGGGVFLSETPESLRDLSEILVHQGFDNAPVLFQEFIETSRGRDIRAFCVGGKVLAAMQRKATDGSFKSNITRGGVGEPVEITPDISKIALDTCRALELEIAGIDLLYTDDGFRICEANSAPDFKGLETFCKVDVAVAIYDYIESCLARERSPTKGNIVQTLFKKWVVGSRHAA